MTGVENLVIYWLGRHNLRRGRKFQQIYQPGSHRGASHQGTCCTGCFYESGLESLPSWLGMVNAG